MNALLLGNGINLLEGFSPDWNKLLPEIAKEYDCKYRNSLSMTLGYEMLENLIMSKDPKLNETAIHRVIAGKTETEKIRKRIDWNDSIHSRLMKLPNTEILTTNYDYSLERSVDINFKKRYLTKETMYSLQRYQEVYGKKVYHIHGECGYPRSICLGFEQYAGSLQRIRNELTRTTADEEKKDGRTFQLADVLGGISERPENSWIYHFFINDVAILGLSLDASEIDLWWLLSYRSKQKLTERLPINNHIRYLDTSNPRKNKNLLAQRKELLDAFDVEYITCNGAGYEERYEDALTYLR